MKIKSKTWKFIWISGIYIILILILYLVIIYKVEWETRDLNRYVYFYDCSGTLCTTETNQDLYYSRILCKDEICPYIVEQKKNYLILKENDKKYLFDYINNKILDNKYNDYHFINNDLIVVKDKSNNYGMIDLQFNLVVDTKYNQIIDYRNGYLIYINNNKYHVKNIITNQDIITNYNQISFFDEKYLITKKDNKYSLYNYNEKKSLKQEYNYLYSSNDYILTFNNKKIDILNKNQESVLIIKINTHYDYLTTQEQKSLNIRVEEGNLLFNVVNSENKYITYSFNLNTGKLNN